MIQKYKRILIFITLSVFTLCTLGYYMYHKPVAGLEHRKPDYSLTPQELLLEFQSNEETANGKYLNKIIELTGVIAEVEEKNITLEVEGEFSQVICEIKTETSLYNLSKGQKVIIKGLCTGYLMDVILVNCNITPQ